MPHSKKKEKVTCANDRRVRWAVGKNVYLPHFRNEVTEALSYTYKSRKEQE